mmetsp:Transcript_301/g.323  ORF Transcript_301/g.323 Transcript_301/m.323 type:complete len:221 (-) Transcript_301:206-868(-)
MQKLPEGDKLPIYIQEHRISRHFEFVHNHSCNIVAVVSLDNNFLPPSSRVLHAGASCESLRKRFGHVLELHVGHSVHSHNNRNGLLFVPADFLYDNSSIHLACLLSTHAPSFLLIRNGQCGHIFFSVTVGLIPVPCCQIWILGFWSVLLHQRRKKFIFFPRIFFEQRWNSVHLVRLILFIECAQALFCRPRLRRSVFPSRAIVITSAAALARANIFEPCV